MQLDGLVPRRVSDLLAEQMRTEPVIALHGLRSVGKSTVLRGFAEAAGGSVIDLDDVEVREAIQGNLWPPRCAPGPRSASTSSSGFQASSMRSRPG